jgi:transcription initiation factor TFIIIB Brf1 subunit/transcription initiation factor TFIIB
MKTTPLTFTCPKCGSVDVFYSCEPKCCFNHVCAVCRTTFEPVTIATGATVKAAAPDEVRDTTGPTCQCAVCESINVHSLEDGRIVCVDCGAILEIEYSGIVEGA